MALPHITNSVAGVNRFDPVHTSLFEVYFTLPEALKQQFGSDEAVLTEHVLSISGLESLDKGPETGEQKFMGTSRSYLNPKLDTTRHEITVKFSLNLRNGVDNYIWKIFKAWNKLSYDLETGAEVLKKDYCADWLKVSIGNRAGDIFREIVFHDVMFYGGLGAWSELEYNNNDALELEVKFVSDWATEVNA
jgi:hypothetical protein